MSQDGFVTMDCLSLLRLFLHIFENKLSVICAISEDVPKLLTKITSFECLKLWKKSVDN